MSDRERMTYVGIGQAKGQLSKLVRRAEAGEVIVITRYGRPVVQLVPVSQPSSRPSIPDE